jgi:hypothetical protein
MDKVQKNAITDYNAPSSKPFRLHLLKTGSHITQKLSLSKSNNSEIHLYWICLINHSVISVSLSVVASLQVFINSKRVQLLGLTSFIMLAAAHWHWLVLPITDNINKACFLTPSSLLFFPVQVTQHYRQRTRAAQNTSEGFMRPMDWDPWNRPTMNSSDEALLNESVTFLLQTVENILQPWAYISPCSRVLIAKLIVAQLLKEFSAFYGIRWFITVFTRARHRSLSWARWIQSMPAPHFPKIHINISVVFGKYIITSKLVILRQVLVQL